MRTTKLLNRNKRPDKVLSIQKLVTLTGCSEWRAKTIIKTFFAPKKRVKLEELL